MIKINAGTGIYTLIGKPIKHSMSPEIYNFGFNYYDMNDIYTCSEFSNLDEGLRAVSTLNFKGFNVTMPYKSEMAKKADRLSNLASLCGSVNTVKCTDKEMYGEMTDGHGFILALQSKGISIKGKNVEIVGAGGAGRALSVAALVNGATSVILSNRMSHNFQKAREMSDNLKSYEGINRLELKLIRSIDSYKPKSDTDILVNATSIGMNNKASIIKEDSYLNKNMTVFDLVYSGERTELIKQARKANAVFIDGKTQLLFQAAAAFKLYTNQEYPVKEYIESLKKIVYLVGFMGAGKSTVGAELAKRAHLPFVDLDRYIENLYNNSVGNIFKFEGEEGFRKKEHKALEQLVKEYKGKDVIVATGGGSVLQKENMELMKKSGKIVHLNMSFGEIINRLNKNPNSRPMIIDMEMEQIGFLYRSRSEIYKKSADIMIVGDNRTPASIVNEIYGNLIV